MKRLSLTVQACLIAGLAAPALADGGTMINLPANHQPTSVSADGTIVLGLFGDQPWMWTEDAGISYLATFGNAGVPFVSRDGSLIGGTALNTKTGTHEAAIWDGSEWVLLGDLGFSCDASASSGWGCNEDGSSIVGLGWVDGCRAHATRWDNMGAGVDLGSTVPDRSSRANGISGDGSVVFGWQDASSGFRQGAYWADGVQTIIQTDTGDSVGEAQAATPDGSRIAGGFLNGEAWLWDENTDVAEGIGLIPGFNFSAMASGINDAGDRVVGFSGFGFDRDGFIWHPEAGIEKILDWANAKNIDNMTGWTDIMIGSAMSGNGRVIAGWGTGPDSFIQGYIMVLDGLCAADIDGSNTVDVNDLLALLAAWGPCEGCPEDLNGDGSVEVNDLLALLAAWGDC